MGNKNSTNDDSKDRVGDLSHAVDEKDLKPGDHIYCYSAFFYRHPKHGIYIGEDNYEVIHFATSGIRETITDWIHWYQHTRVRSCSLKEFLNGSTLRLVSYDDSQAPASDHTRHKEKAVPLEETVMTAKHYEKNPKLWGQYDEKKEQ
uniref:LRAT domain-containing protein n=1 Tax=Amphimedon queenslandica TaxID=400682 RepID=A0A1X7V5W7_AMPQE